MSGDPVVKGVQDVQAAAVKLLNELTPKGALGKAVQYATGAAHRYMVGITPVKTGAWRGSHLPEMQGLHGRIAINPEAVNPAGGRPIIYGTALEQQRGGKYAVYAKTANEAGPKIVKQAGDLLRKELP